MMRILGNTAAKVRRLQSRNISSASVIAVAAVNNAPVYLARMVVGGVGYMIGGWVSAPAAKFLQETEEMQLEIKQELDENEARLDEP
ncbi:unnamed protein product [Arabidopsis halleri]